MAASAYGQTIYGTAGQPVRYEHFRGLRALPTAGLGDNPPNNVKGDPNEVVTVSICRLFWPFDYDRHPGVPENCIWRTDNSLQDVKAVRQQYEVTGLIPGLHYR
jgi:hypothetical protein